MIIEVQGSSSTPYKVDTEKVTCTCPNFRYRCSHFSVDSENRLCKHLREVYEQHPELASVAIQIVLGKYADTTMEPTEDPDGKTRYPISFFDSYVFDIKSIMKNYSQDIDKYEFCGSYRRRAERVSDLDVLIVLKDGHSPEDMLNYCEQIMGYERLWRGDKKASYKIDGIVQVDFKFVPADSWAFATMHFTGSKNYNIMCRQKSLQLGYSLSEYGFKDKDGNIHTFGCNTEEDIHRFLKLPYLEPWNRK